MEEEGPGTKRKRERPSSDEPPSSEAQATNAANGKSGKKKRRKVNDADLSDAERARREYQRHQRELAVKMRAQGKDYYKPMKKVQALPKTNNRQEQSQNQEKKSKHMTPIWRPDAEDVEVAIIPIFWNTHRDEKARVIKAAEKAEKNLQGWGIKTTIDVSNKYTPGQKMKFWELQGVRVRLEIGPRDADSGTAMMAIARTPGEVALKKSVKVDKGLHDKVRAALQEGALPQSDTPATGSKPKEAAVEEGAVGEEEEEAKAVSNKKEKAAKKKEKKEKKKKKEKRSDADEATHQQEDDEEHENEIIHDDEDVGEDEGGQEDVDVDDDEEVGFEKAMESDEPRGGVKEVGGDALDDDFDIDVDAEEDELLGVGKKTKWDKKKKKKTSLGGSGGDNVPLWEQTRAAKKKPKVVKF